VPFCLCAFLPIFPFVSVLSLGMNFRPPTAAERLNAIGSVKGLPETLRKVLTAGEDFEPVGVPKPGDWLAAHRETGQSFDDFVASKPNRPDKYRGKIYLQPLGEFPNLGRPGYGSLRRDEQQASLGIPLVERLKEYASAYFSMPVQEIPPLNLKDRNITTRINAFTRNRQILTGDVLAILKANLPKDAFCVMAITMQDLYPDPSWNFVFGQASLRERVGVWSAEGILISQERSSL
jgi:archaemetzincin